jgi:hypothetical protein
VPTVGSPPVVPFTCQLTLVSLVLVTVATKALVVPTATLAEVGAIVTRAVGSMPAPPFPPPVLQAATITGSNSKQALRWKRIIPATREPARAAAESTASTSVLIPCGTSGLLFVRARAD